MILGTTIQIPGIMGVPALDCTLPESDTNRRVKVYLVPEAVSADRYYIGIIEPGGIENIPPSRGRDTLLLVDYSLSETGESTINYINEEVRNA
jgi:hypothetical protein